MYLIREIRNKLFYIDVDPIPLFYINFIRMVQKGKK